VLTRSTAGPADGATLYVTNPGAGTVVALDVASGKVIATASGLAEPYSVTVTPNGSTLYVNLDAALTDIAFAPAP
jgi:YVTN family beta-propeller protein